jgi:hypothetical protein
MVGKIQNIQENLKNKELSQPYYLSTLLKTSFYKYSRRKDTKEW